jgi:hypothetical protein
MPFFIKTLTLIFLIFSFSGCSHQNTQASVIGGLTDATLKANGTYYTIVTFEQGSAYLSEKDKVELKQFLSKAMASKRDNKMIHIFSWGDSLQENIKSAQVDLDAKLVEQRIQEIEKFLKGDPKTVAGFGTYNMVKQPHRLDAFLHSDDPKSKKVFEKTGEQPSEEGGDLASMLNDKKSKALVTADYE